MTQSQITISAIWRGLYSFNSCTDTHSSIWICISPLWPPVLFFKLLFSFFLMPHYVATHADTLLQLGMVISLTKAITLDWSNFNTSLYNATFHHVTRTKFCCGSHFCKQRVDPWINFLLWTKQPECKADARYYWYVMHCLHSALSDSS